MLANYACDQNKLRGRLFKEKKNISIYSDFDVDRERIITSTAFRRLEHKTQVFVSNEGDHYRNRLTHSIEAAHIARVMSNALNISADLAENLTLAHDIGHAPFGHAGEEALKKVMREYDLEFDHNSHAIKLLTSLEKKYPEFDGLNLTWEFLEGVAKHNGPILNPSKVIASYSSKHDLDLTKYSSLEAQISALADDIAYNNHDIEDGFRAGLLKLEQLKSLSKLGHHINQVEREYNNLEDRIILYEAVQRMKNEMIIDAVENTKNNIKKFAIETSQDVRDCMQTLALFSDSMEVYHKEIKSFLMDQVYNHFSVRRMTNKGKRYIESLFYLYMDDLKCLPSSWQANITLLERREAAIVVCDFIACMSDRYAMAEYHSFF
jgi:dGTPase